MAIALDYSTHDLAPHPARPARIKGSWVAVGGVAALALAAFAVQTMDSAVATGLQIGAVVATDAQPAPSPASMAERFEAAKRDAVAEELPAQF